MKRKIQVKAPDFNPPKGLYFVRVNYNYGGATLYLMTRNIKNPIAERKIGSISLEKGRRRLMTHSNLDVEWRNQGLGALMYAHAIAWCHKYGYTIGSSNSPSEDAQRVWEGSLLKKYFKIRKRKNNSYYDRHYWVAYPKK